MLLEAHDVTVRFGGLVAVDTASATVDAGEIVGLIGPNGAGKTSLLDAIGGQLVPDDGRVFLSGHDVTDREPEQRAVAGLARTFQRLELFRTMSVFENLLVAAEARFGEAAFVGDLVGLRRSRGAEERVREVLARLSLEEVADRRADQLPAGTGRLAEIGRALCSGPSLLLLDEPAGGLDEEETDRLGETLAVLGGDDLGILLVEHDVELVMDLCDRVAVMDFGRIIASGPPASVREDPAVLAAYLGTEEVSGAGAPGGA